LIFLENCQKQNSGPARWSGQGPRSSAGSDELIASVGGSNLYCAALPFIFGAANVAQRVTLAKMRQRFGAITLDVGEGHVCGSRCVASYERRPV
jgi:hypothetical protein